MNSLLNLAIFIVVFCLSIDKVQSQDTIRYEGILKGILLFESIELFPNKTFKWTSEYDLTWSEYGKYQMGNEKLILKFYSQFNAFEEAQNTNVFKKDSFLIEKDQLYRLNKKGKKIKRKYD